ncbi:hypothetical protein Tco_1493171 [Tanacetum coccineum]
MSFSKRPGHDAVCYTKPLDSLKEMNLLSFIRTADPMKVRIGERQRGEDEPKLLDTTVGRVVPLLPVAPARASSELEASVDKLFEEGGNGSHAEQGDSVSGGHDVGIPQVSETAEVFAEDAAPLQPRRQRKRKTVVSDAGEPSHPPKKLREDHGISTGPSVAEREDGGQTDFMAGANLRTITAPPRFVIYSDSSHHSGANIAKAEVDYFARRSAPLMTMTTTVTSTVDPTTIAKEKLVESFIFGGGSSSGAEHTVGGFSGLTGSDFIVGGIRTIVSPETDIQKVYIPQWSVTNGSCLDDARTCREMVDEFAPPKFFASIRRMGHDELFTKFNVGAARQMSFSVEVRMRAEFNIREKRRLSAVVEEKNSLLKARDEEVASLKAQLLVKEAEATKAVRLRSEVQTLMDLREQEVADLDAMVASVKVHNDNLSDQVHTLEVSSAGLQEKVTAYENFIDTDLVELALHLEEKFYPHLLTTISGCRWLLTYGLEFAVAKCLNSTEYLSAFGAGIGKAIEKGMQEGLSAGITHGAVGRVLIDVAAYNPSAEADYLSALQRLQSVNFSLIAELKSNKDANVDTIMNLLRLEDSLAERLDVSSSRVHRVKGNVANHRSALRDVFVPLSEPLSATALMGTEVDTPITLSTTLASASIITPISIEDYEVTGTDGQEAMNESIPNNATDGNVNPFPNVDDVELNVSQ